MCENFIESLNVRSRRAAGLEAALRSLEKINSKISVPQETNLTEGIRTCYSAGYKVWAPEAEIRHRDRIPIQLPKSHGL